MTAYINNILIYSETLEKHCEHVKTVLKRLREAELQVNIDKCKFHKKEMKFLRIIIKVNDVQIDSERFKAILK